MDSTDTAVLTAITVVFTISGLLAGVLILAMVAAIHLRLADKI